MGTGWGDVIPRTTLRSHSKGKVIHLYHLDPENLLKPGGTWSPGCFGANLPLSWLMDPEVNEYEQRIYHNLEG